MSESQRRSLAASIAAVFAVSAPSAGAVVVSSCNDAGAGTLRDIILNLAGTPSGSTVDTSACSTITLTTGAIGVAQSALKITGPAGRTTITAVGSAVHDRIFNHQGTGILTLENLNIEYGRADTAAVEKGGCVYSKGTVYLHHSGVSQCTARSSLAAGAAYGGGIFSTSLLRVKYSTISNNSAYSGDGISRGGGAYSKGGLIAKYSTIAGNYAGRLAGDGGGLFIVGSADVRQTTVSANTAGLNHGGISLDGAPAAVSAKIVNSTISGNHAASGLVGGIYSRIPITMYNSTVAFNAAKIGTQGAQYLAPGMALSSAAGSITANLQSSLFSNNIVDPTAPLPDDNDLSIYNAAAHTVTISGANNLVYSAFGGLSTQLQTDGIAMTGAASCPLLGPLRDNGGLTATHQLFSHSPAIDAGNNTASPTLSYDQRGLGYGRESGPAGSTPAADIGAYEVQQDDVIFNSGFDGCPPG
jgi:hypothetical protein